jgi:RND family efflux transporter MFP subunit
MKSILSILALLFLVFACQAPAEEGSIPETLAEKRTLLRSKQQQAQALNAEIAELEAAILAQDPDAREAGVLVSTQTLARGNFSSYVTLQGSVAADALVGASSELAGRITRLTVKEGDAVRKGQLIALIDAEALEKQRAELQTSLELATTIYERQKRLWDQNIGSEIQYLQAKNNKERLEKSLEILDVQLTKNRVFAPISGVVERELLQPGELASPGMPIVQILNTNELKVVADVPENYINAVREGKRVLVRVPALGLEKSLPISLVGKTVDPANRTFKVETRLPLDSRLKPNLLAEMQLEDHTIEDVVTVPLNLVQQEIGGRRYVLVAAPADEGYVARKVPVTIGEAFGGMVVVESGLDGGEQLITDGARGLTEGQEIEIDNTQKTK